MPGGQSMPSGYLSGSSVTTTMRFAPSAATWRAICRHGEAALVALAAGHRDGVVEQDLVGDVDAGRGRGADRQIAGMVVGAVAEILEHVAALRERRLADPVRALAAHLGEAAAWSGPSTAPCNGSRCRHRRACPPAPWSRYCAGSRSRNTACAPRRPASRRATRCACFRRATRPRARRCRRTAAARSPIAIAMSFGSSAPLTGNSQLPCSSFLPMQIGWFGGAVKLLAHLHLDQRALLLDHDDEVEAVGEVDQLRAARAATGSATL